MFCFHKYGEIKERYQYCQKCGKAIVAPCAHYWKCVEISPLWLVDKPTEGQNPNSIIWHLQCEICGEMKQYKLF